PWTDEFGIVADDDGRLAGFLGVVYAERPVSGGLGRSGNLTSWYIEKPYRGRGLGLDMLRAATSRADVTYTTFSSNPPALRLMEKAGLELLDDRRLIWDTGARPDPPGVEILTEPNEIHRHLSAGTAQVMADHAGLNVRPYLIRSDSGTDCLVLLYVKEKGADIAYHEILHVSDPAIFGRHAAAFAA
ncbi:MAG: GNAT family N-acetyltransferase, partial [bacterium]|nr:GNAT family N-acetyltransferase [bacterium]